MCQRKPFHTSCLCLSYVQDDPMEQSTTEPCISEGILPGTRGPELITMGEHRINRIIPEH